MPTDLSTPSIAFFVPDETDVDALKRLDCDCDWKAFIQGERCWILQTYLRLREAGGAVELTAEYPDADIAVVHPYFLGRLLRPPAGKQIPIVVMVADDKGYCDLVDVQLVQNSGAAGSKAFFVPLWPQPGLIRRDPGRGERVERVAYKGFDVCLDEDFRAPAWETALKERGLVWDNDSFRALDRGYRPDDLHWNDYSQTDLIVAVRPPAPGMYRHKPGTKLVLAWLAGVPAILGPERAYRDLRQSELDYIEVQNTTEALAAVDHLREDPELYRAMVENGKKRRGDHNREAVLRRWQEVLFEEIPQYLSRGHPPLLRDDPRRRRTCWWWSSRMRWKWAAAKRLSGFLAAFSR